MKLPNKRYLELIRHSGSAELKQEASRAYLGILWWILDPIFYLSVFYVVFVLVFKRGGEGFVPFLLCGLVFWRWFDSSIRLAGDSINRNRGILSQVYLPKILLPIVALYGNLLKFFIIFIIFLIFVVLNGYMPNESWLVIPVLFMVQFLFIVACGCLLSAVVPFMPDLMQIISYTMTLLFFMSGIFFDPYKVEGPVQQWLFYNPMVVIISSWRRVLLEGSMPDWAPLLIVMLASILILAVALGLLKRFDLYYPRLVN